MTECQRCGGKAQVFLCRRDIDALAELLYGLPRWLGFLSETVFGQTKLGDPQRRHKGDEQPMRYNPAAAELYDAANNTLTTWLRHLCEQRGIDVPLLNTNREVCNWLRANVNAIAADEAALEIFSDIEDLVTSIERRINRPIPPRFLGPCITDPVEEETLTERRYRGDHATRCNRALAAERGAKDVTCPDCKRTHNVETMVEQLYAQAGHALMTVRELIDWVLPRLDEPIPQTTLERWIRLGIIPVRGRDSKGTMMVQLSDVRVARTQGARHAKHVKA